MYYHASQTPNIKVLEPRVSNHGKPLVYLSTKRENVLVYLSNAIEKFCRDTGFSYDGKWQKWGPYGFTQDGRMLLEEYYPNAFEETYKGVSGNIYYTETIPNLQTDIQISNAIATAEPVPIDGAEFVPDAYEAILEAAEKGLIVLGKYEDHTEKKLDWIKSTMKKEYQEVGEQLDYKHFIEGKFPSILE